MMYFNSDDEQLEERQDTPGVSPEPVAAPVYSATPLEEEPPTPTQVEPLKVKNAHAERGAATILMVLALVLGGTAVLIALRWPAALGGAFSPSYTMHAPLTPADAPERILRRAETGDGTVLTLADRGEAASMGLQDIYKKVLPSVVSITATLPRGAAEGTGVIMSADGYIITNSHVIEGSYRLDISLEDGRTCEALLVGGDEQSDLAVLKINLDDLTPAEFGNSEALLVGDTVAAIGNPMGKELRGTLTNGILSAINRDMRVDGNNMTLLQTTAALNSGNSGGALVNDGGQVIGITNMKLVNPMFDTPIEGLGFAIPSTTVKAVVDALIAEGHVSGRPALGIVVRPAAPTELAPYGTAYGLWTEAVLEGSDARTQDVRPGDVILTANGVKLSKNQDLLDVKTPLAAGDSIHLTVGRDGKVMDVTIKLVEQYQLDAMN